MSERVKSETSVNSYVQNDKGWTKQGPVKSKWAMRHGSTEQLSGVFDNCVVLTDPMMNYEMKGNLPLSQF